ncbi:MAG: hypothetical protein JWO09_781 [Bacteroidetes bacterium]|nr:hypothetical protein [Bacteroidota bacterium]
MQLTYSNNIIASGQWPSVSVTYAFSATEKIPVLNLAFTFDPSCYTGSEASANAQADLLTYLQLYAQLGSTTIKATYSTSVESSVDATGGFIPVNHTVNLPELVKAFINPIIIFLKAVAEGTPSVDVEPYAISSPLATASITSLPEIMELNTTFSIEETSGTIAGTVTTNILPLADYTISGIPPFLHFAQEFEAAFINQPSAGIVLKLALNNSDNSKAPSPTIIRFDTAGAKGIKFLLQGDQSSCFAPLPLLNSLQSFTTNISLYVEGQPYPAGTASRSFSAIDADVYGRKVLEAIDQFPGSRTAVPAFLLSAGKLFTTDPDYLQEILAVKQTLVNAITGTIDTITESGDKAHIAEAQLKWTELLQDKLSYAYSYTAAIQAAAVIQSHLPIQATTTVPQSTGYRLNGSITGMGASGNEFTLTGAGLPLTDGSARLNYLFGTETVSANSSFTFTNIHYNATELQQELQQGLVTTLSFIIPADGAIAGGESPLAAMCDAGPLGIPVPLREFPASPVLDEQHVAYPVNGTHALDVDAARKWNYCYSYRNSAVAQDYITAEIRINPVKETASTLPGSLQAMELCRALVQFNAVYPEICNSFDNALAVLTPDTISTTDAAVTNSRYALLAFTAIVKDVAEAWALTNQVSPLTNVTPLNVSASSLTASVLSHTITETAQPETGYLLVNIEPEGPQTVSSGISLIIEGYTAEPVDGSANTYLYASAEEGEEKTYLLYSDRNKNSLRTVILEGLDVLNSQSAQVAVMITRNAKLLRDATGSWQPINPGFIYKTAQVTFSGMLQPLLRSQAINIASIGTKNYPVQPQRTLSENLLAMCDALTENVNGASYNVRIKCEYTYTLEENNRPVSIPIALLITELRIDDKGKSLAVSLAAGISGWLKTQQPVTGGRYDLAFTAYAPEAPQRPVLEIPFMLDRQADDEKI